jgi:hypothetical protein
VELLPGFVSVPRLVGSPRPAGAFFSAVVEGPAGPGAWTVRLDGKVQVVLSDLSLTPGQVLRLKSSGVQDGRWILQVLPTRAEASSPSAEWGSLAAAFLARGLPAAAERLGVWSRWMTGPAPSDKEAWAAGLELRGQGPQSPLTDHLEPWLVWQKALEEGRSEPPPDTEDFWDLWNLKTPPGGYPWIALPLRWVYEGQEDAGLLQARWNPPAQRVDQWNLTAAPAGYPCRIEAQSRPGRLDITWRFFQSDHLASWQGRIEGWARRLSSPELAVSLLLAGPSKPPLTPGGPVDVQA